MLRTAGLNTQSGTASATYSIPHGLPFTPYYISVSAGSHDALGFVSGSYAQSFYITADNTNINITYAEGVDSGTNNLSWYWSAECN